MLRRHKAIVAKYVTGCSIFSTVQSFQQDYRLLLELQEILELLRLNFLGHWHCSLSCASHDIAIGMHGPFTSRVNY